MGRTVLHHLLDGLPVPQFEIGRLRVDELVLADLQELFAYFRANDAATHGKARPPAVLGDHEQRHVIIFVPRKDLVPGVLKAQMEGRVEDQGVRLPRQRPAPCEQSGGAFALNAHRDRTGREDLAIRRLLTLGQLDHESGSSMTLQDQGGAEIGQAPPRSLLTDVGPGGSESVRHVCRFRPRSNRSCSESS